MTTSGSTLGASARPPAQQYDVLLLDLDGVVYLGPTPVTHAVEALALASELGIRMAYVTNNASRPPSVVAEHLRSFGLPVQPHDVVTSAQAGARVLVDLVPPGSRVLVVGGAGLVEALGERGFVPVRSAADHPAAVIQGFSPDIGWELLAEGAYALATGIPWIATNADLTVPTPRGIAPGNGSLVQVLASTTGRSPVVAGKPMAPLMLESIERTAAKHALVVGDRLDTDIEGASRVGVDSLLVFTGVSRPRDVVMAPPGLRPTLLARDLRGLLEAHPLVEVSTPGVADCLGWRVEIQAAGVQIVAHGADPLDGLRAACGAAWSAADAGIDVEPTIPDVLAGLASSV